MSNQPEQTYSTDPQYTGGPAEGDPAKHDLQVGEDTGEEDAS